MRVARRSPVLPMCLAASLLCALASADPERTNHRGSEKELLLELQDVLGKLQSKRGGLWESKAIRVPKCTVGDPCAVKRGLRIGRLCDCPRRSACSPFFLRCL